MAEKRLLPEPGVVSIDFSSFLFTDDYLLQKIIDGHFLVLCIVQQANLLQVLRRSNGQCNSVADRLVKARIGTISGKMKSSVSEELETFSNLNDSGCAA